MTRDGLSSKVTMFALLTVIATLPCACGTSTPRDEGPYGPDSPAAGEEATQPDSAERAGTTPTEAATPTTSLAWLQTQLFSPTCARGGCHDATRAGGLDLRPRAAYANLVSVPAQNAGANGMLRVAPGDPEASFLVVKLQGPGPDQGARMPFGAPPVTAGILDAVRGWIARGAPDE